MYLYYCSDPDCPGHYKSWERCSDLKAFNEKSDCAHCALAAKSCMECVRAAVSGLFSITLPAGAGY